MLLPPALTVAMDEEGNLLALADDREP